MPLLFNLAIHDALVAVKAELRDGEVLFAFLDDVYTVDRIGLWSVCDLNPSPRPKKCQSEGGGPALTKMRGGGGEGAVVDLPE